jgi:hypothetical protein
VLVLLMPAAHRSPLLMQHLHRHRHHQQLLTLLTLLLVPQAAQTQH